jgi:hypothetical protein
MCLLAVMAALLRMSFELSQQSSSAEEKATHKSLGSDLNPSTVSDELTPWEREVAEKAARRYAETQTRRMRRWREAMFERV